MELEESCGAGKDRDVALVLLPEALVLALQAPTVMIQEHWYLMRLMSGGCFEATFIFDYIIQ